MRRNHPFDRSIVAVCLVKISSFAEVAIIMWRRFWRWANNGKYVLVKMDWSKRVLRKSSEHLIFYLIPPSLHLLTESLEISHRYSQSYKIFCPPRGKGKRTWSWVSSLVAKSMKAMIVCTCQQLLRPSLWERMKAWWSQKYLESLLLLHMLQWTNWTSYKSV